MNPKSDLFLEINSHLLLDEKPSEYINMVSNGSLFMEEPFVALNLLKKTKQSPKYHAEGSAWNHTMMVVDEAAKVKYKSSKSKAFMWAALLHDIGKPSTTVHRNGKITSYDHDTKGAKLAEDFLLEFSSDSDFIKNVVSLVKWHMQILHVVNNLKFSDVKSMKSDVDINEVALLGLCDRLGRAGADKEKERENIRIFLNKCK